MKKNLVLIMADQLRKDFLGCYGNPYVRTPNLDKLASMGQQFDRCFVNNPICMPNRMSIFTGRYPHNHGMWTNGLMLPHPLPTIADYLKANGYDTCSIGKLHFEPTDCGDDCPMGSHEDHRRWKQMGDNVDWFGPYWGFDHVEFTSGHATAPLAHYGKWFREHGGTNDMAKAIKTEDFQYCPVTTMPERLHDSLFVGERSAAYIREHDAKSDKPFFLVTSFPDPHHPFNPPMETALRYKDTPVRMPINEEDDLATRPLCYRQHKNGIWHRAGVLKATDGVTQEQVDQTVENIAAFMDAKILEGLGLTSNGGNGVKEESIGPRERDERIRNTYAMVDLIDQGVGKVVEALEETGHMEDTLIVVTSDHGELMGDHGVWLKGPFFYDGLLNVPLIVIDPACGAGKVNAIASSVDIFPTCCDLLGLEIPHGCDGVSQRAALSGGTPREAAMVEYRNGYFDADVYRMVYIDDRYKFVQYQTGECELTDRINDPEENVNLSGDAAYKDVLAEYREKLLLMVLNTGSKMPDQICHA